jgi:hypothetical protein
MIDYMWGNTPQYVGGLGLKREYPSQPAVGVEAVIREGGKLDLVKRGVELSMDEWSIPGGYGSG